MESFLTYIQTHEVEEDLDLLQEEAQIRHIFWLLSFRACEQREHGNDALSHKVAAHHLHTLRYANTAA